jgi:26S proteasome regulatory subunit T1
MLADGHDQDVCFFRIGTLRGYLRGKSTYCSGRRIRCDVCVSKLANNFGSQYLPSCRYVPVHLEYILTEILKNSFRASVEHHHKKYGTSSRVPIPSIILTIAPVTSRGEKSPSYLSLRIRDEGGGIPPANLDKIFSYSFTTAGRTGTTEDEGLGGGPYAAQHVGGMAAIDEPDGGGIGSSSSMFGEITGKGLQTGLGTIAGLGYGFVPLSCRQI